MSILPFNMTNFFESSTRVCTNIFTKQKKNDFDGK